MTAPAGYFADLADALFEAAQFEAERIVVMRDLINRGDRGLVERRLAEAELRGRRLVEAFNLLYDLAPHEARSRAAIAAILTGSRDFPTSGTKRSTSATADVDEGLA